MNSEDFVEKIKLYVRDAALQDCVSILSNPPGRSPDKRLLELSRWYKSLAEADQEMLRSVAREAVDIALFGFFCLLDGVRTFDDQGGRLALYYQSDNERTLLNDSTTEYLHDIFKDLADKA